MSYVINPCVRYYKMTLKEILSLLVVEVAHSILTSHRWSKEKKPFTPLVCAVTCLIVISDVTLKCDVHIYDISVTHFSKRFLSHTLLHGKCLT